MMTNRPAETTTAVAGGLAVLIVTLLGVEDVEVVVALTAVISAIPAAVTYVVQLWRDTGGRDVDER